MRKIRIVALLVLCAFVFAFAATPAKSSESSDESVPTLYLSGTPRDMGLKQGLLLSESIKENLNLFWEAVVNQSLSKEELLAQTIEREQFLRSEEREEISAMAEAAGVNYLELVAFNTFGENFMGGECTSGIAAGTGTLTGQAIGHKNRDATGTQVFVIFEPRPGYRYRYAGVKYSGHIGISHGINELGIGEGNLLLEGPSDYAPGVDNLMVNRIIIENSSSVDEAIAYLNREIRQDPSCFFVVDTNKAAYIEWVPSRPEYPAPGVVVNIVENGVAAHTNHYIYEPLKTRWPVSPSSSTVVRYNRMNALMTNNAGQITVKLMISFSRNSVTPSPIDGAGTISAAIMTPHKTYPTWLSTMWTAMYRPGYCIYVPLHNAIFQQPTLAFTLLAPWNGTAYIRGYDLRLKYGTGAPWTTLRARFVQVEDDIRANNEFNEALVVNALQKGASLEDCAKHLITQDSWTAMRVLRVEQVMYDTYPNPTVTSLYIPQGPARARLTVQTDPADVCAPLLGEGWYDLSTGVSIKVPATVPVSAGVQYEFDHWTVDSTTVPGNPITVTMTANYTATAYYNLQYYLTVVSPYGTPSGEGWYNKDAPAYAEVTPLTVPGPEGVQYVFTHWSGDASGTTSPSDQIIMDGPKTAVANWKTQYYLTVTSPYDTPSGEGWYDEGDTAYAMLDYGLVYVGGVPYGFTGWSVDASGIWLTSNGITMDGPKTAVALWEVASATYGDVRTVGFWRHQFTVWYRSTLGISGTGTAQVSDAELEAYLTFIWTNSEYFKAKYPSGITKMDAYILLAPLKTHTMKDSAEQQLFAVWLNLARKAFFLYTELSQETIYVYYQYNLWDNNGLQTIAEAIKWSEKQLTDDVNFEAAKNVCDSINNNWGILWGT